MVNIPAGLAVERNASAAGTPAVGIRRAFAALVKQSAPGVAVAGRLATDHFVVAGSASSMDYTVTGGGLVLARTAPNGAWILGSHETLTLTGQATAGVNPRIDRIYALQPDPGLDGDETDPQAVIGVVFGTPASSPTVPAIPAGALELARKLVAHDATNSRDGAAFTNVAPVTGLIGAGGDPATLPPLFRGRIRRSDNTNGLNGGGADTYFRWSSIEANTLNVNATNGPQGTVVILPAGTYMLSVDLPVAVEGQNWSQLFVTVGPGGTVLAGDQSEWQTPSGFYELMTMRMIHSTGAAPVTIYARSNGAGTLRSDGTVRVAQV